MRRAINSEEDKAAAMLCRTKSVEEETELEGCLKTKASIMKTLRLASSVSSVHQILVPVNIYYKKFECVLHVQILHVSLNFSRKSINSEKIDEFGR